MIEVNHLNIRFGTKRALDDLSLKVSPGESLLLAGANGSGKTTLLRVLAGVLHNREGSVRIDGDKISPRTRAKTAYIPSSISFYDGFRIHEAIRFHGFFFKNFKYRGIGGYRFDPSRRVGSLSRGEKTLFSLSLALSASPSYLLVDDVIHFLDPHLREIFLQTLLDRLGDGTLAVIIATQSPMEMEGIPDRVVLLRRGRVLLDEGVDELKRSLVKVYADEKTGSGLPVVFSREWQGTRELFLYPWSPDLKVREPVHHLNLPEILRAFIGGDYDQG